MGYHLFAENIPVPVCLWASIVLWCVLGLPVGGGYINDSVTVTDVGTVTVRASKRDCKRSLMSRVDLITRRSFPAAICSFHCCSYVDSSTPPLVPASALSPWPWCAELAHMCAFIIIKICDRLGGCTRRFLSQTAETRSRLACTVMQSCWCCCCWGCCESRCIARHADKRSFS